MRTLLLFLLITGCTKDYNQTHSNYSEAFKRLAISDGYDGESEEDMSAFCNQRLTDLAEYISSDPNDQKLMNEAEKLHWREECSI